MELTAVAQLRRMVLEHLSRYTWNNELPDHVYDILQEVREDTPRYRCCVYKERAVLKNRIDMALGQECSSNIIEAAKLTLNEPERTDLPIIDGSPQPATNARLMLITLPICAVTASPINA